MGGGSSEGGLQDRGEWEADQEEETPGFPEPFMGGIGFGFNPNACLTTLVLMVASSTAIIATFGWLVNRLRRSA